MAIPIEEQESGFSMNFRKGLLELYGTFRRSVALTVSVLGIFLILMGYLIELVHPTMGGIFAIWGIAGVFTGVLAYAIVWMNKRFR